ncbi:MAG: LysM peptidoglycan-binding domain-containing protein [Anaerolineales bacterium]|nr:LysM peptidoglycan-binding domain-containing protein [Anaerolineales bacterium]
MTHQPGKVCPHLGIADDAATHMNFPSPANRCFNCRPPNAPSLAHQQGYCLSVSYGDCREYLGNGVMPMPADIVEVVPVPGTGFNMGLKIALIVAVLLIAAGPILFRNAIWPDVFSPQVMPAPPAETITPASSPTSSPVSQPSATVSASAAPIPPAATTSLPLAVPRMTDTFTSTPTSTTTPAYTATATFTPLPHPHSFEVTQISVGGQYTFLVHIVEWGETLDMIANKYGTTVQAIMAVNYELKPPVWAQYPIVIPVGAQDTVGLPAFEVYVVEDETVSSESLAGTLGVDIEDLQRYNLCTGGCQFDKGDVLLIPR